MAERFLYELHKGCFRDNGVEMSINDVLNTLNEQHEQIEDLKDANVRCCNEYSYFHKRMMELEKENEQLKEELEMFKPVMFQDMRKGTVILYRKGELE